MSKIGKKPITIPENVQISIKGTAITVKFKDNQLTETLPKSIKIEIKDNQILVSPKFKSSQTRAFHGLARSLIANMIEGLTKGYIKILEVQGTGYRVNPKGRGIEMSLGFSHPVEYQPPVGITLEIKGNDIIIKGSSKQLVGQVAADIRRFRPPDIYKGKGIRLKDEIVRLKPGKAAKAAGAEG